MIRWMISESESLRPNYPRMRAAIIQSKSFAYVGPSDWTLPAPGIAIPVTHLSSCRDDLRLSYFLTQALMPLKSIANLNDAILYSYLITLRLRTVYLINFQNLNCVDIGKCQVMLCLLLDFLT